jgi:hypothetical protein
MGRALSSGPSPPFRSLRAPCPLRSTLAPRDTAWAMSEENVELALRAVHAWNDDGAAAILPYLDPEIEWHQPRESMEPRNYRGQAEVGDYLGRLAEIFSGAPRAEPVDVIDVEAERLIAVIRRIVFKRAPAAIRRSCGPGV